MLVAVDFDGTIVERTPPLRLIKGAHEGLVALREAGHTLLLYSARANRAKRFNPELDPLVRAGLKTLRLEEIEDMNRRLVAAERHRRLFDDMVTFVGAMLPGVFAAIDDGQQGKPLADLFIDDKAVNVINAGGPLSSGWDWIAQTYGMVR